MKDNDLIQKVGNEVFYKSRKTFSYESLLTKVLGSNTYRGFHKIDKSKPGSKEVFESLFIKNKDIIIDTLKKIKSERSLNTFESEICKELKNALKKNINNSQLYSFNKLRKPIDIAIELFVIMCDDLIDKKSLIVQHLFLPLDSQMFLSSIVFTDDEIKQLNIKRNFTFKDIYDEQHYFEIQGYLKQKAEASNMHRIYFDLVWGDRYKKKSSEIFQI